MKSNQSLTVTIAIRDKDGRIVGSKQVVKYEGLLARAHEEGLRSISTDLIQAPSKENAQVAIVRAVVTTSKGTFTGIGDANPSNVNKRICGHLIRMAETRGKARALRDAINVGTVALEEIDDIVDDTEAAPADEPIPYVPAKRGAETATKPAEPAAVVSPSGIGTFQTMTEPQRRMIFRLATQRGVAPENVRTWLMAQPSVPT